MAHQLYAQPGCAALYCEAEFLLQVLVDGTPNKLLKIIVVIDHHFLALRNSANGCEWYVSPETLSFILNPSFY